MPNAEQRDRQKPEQHHRPEQSTDHASAAALNREQPDQDHDRARHDRRRERLSRHPEPFHRAQHGDRGCDDAVAE
jgi:hypothetical protein